MTYPRIEKIEAMADYFNCSKSDLIEDHDPGDFMCLKNINRLKKEKGLTNETLADLSGVPKSTVAKIASGITKNPSISALQAIAKALGCSLDELCGNAEMCKKDICETSREYIAQKLKELRLKTGLTAEAVGKMVRKSGKTVNAWENNRGQPDTECLMMLCDIYKVENILEEFRNPVQKRNVDSLEITDSEFSLIQKYRHLDSDGQYMIDTVINVELERCERPAPMERILYYDLPALADTENYLEAEYPTYMEIPREEIPYGADFAVRIAGDSMEPDFFDGDVVLVKRGKVRQGDVGIFVINDEGYIKELGDGVLISHNKKYADIEISENDFQYVLGRVVCKLQKVPNQ